MLRYSHWIRLGGSCGQFLTFMCLHLFMAPCYFRLFVFYWAILERLGTEYSRNCMYAKTQTTKGEQVAGTEVKRVKLDNWGVNGNLVRAVRSAVPFTVHLTNSEVAINTVTVNIFWTQKYFKKIIISYFDLFILHAFAQTHPKSPFFVHRFEKF